MTTRSTLSPAADAMRSPTAGSQAPTVGADARRFEARRIRAVLRPFRTPVRGHAFAAAPVGGSEPEPGLRARLAREPGNPADPLAVAVWVETVEAPPWRIGYLDRGVAARVAPRLDAGVQLDARIEGWVAEPQGRWHRPLVLLVPEAREDPADANPVEVVRGADAGQLGGPAPAEPTPAGPVADHLWGRPPGVSRRVVRPG